MTGAGGQHLYDPEQQDDPATGRIHLQAYLKVHSLSVVEIDGADPLRSVSSPSKATSRPLRHHEVT